MKAADILESCLGAIEANDFAKASSLVADDFQLSGPVPVPVGKSDFINLSKALREAAPDWKFNISKRVDQGPNACTFTLNISGTQTRELTFPMLGLDHVPPTGKHFQLPAEVCEVTVENGKLKSMENVPVEGGGVMGVLSQIGIKVPQPA